METSAFNVFVAIQVITIFMIPGSAFGDFIPNVDTILYANQNLGPGEYMQVAGYGYAQMQTDCNFVLYEGFGPLKKPLWASLTYNRGSNCYLAMQQDCNLVVYDDQNKPLWSSRTQNEGVQPCSLWLRYFDAGAAGSPVLQVLDANKNDWWSVYKNCC